MPLVQYTVESSAVLTLFTAPIALIGPPGLGKTIQVLNYIYEIKFNTVAYLTGADRFALNYDGNGALDNNCIDGGALADFLTVEQSSFAYGVGCQLANSNMDTPVVFNRTVVENKGVRIIGNSANPTLGNSRLFVTINYEIYTFQG